MGANEILAPSKYSPFLDRIFQGLEEHNVMVEDYFLDHICYRVGSRERYDFMRTDLLRYHSLLGETMISGRPIANFLLSSPLRYKNRLIPILELPAPKPFSHYEEGYEHVEFVVNSSLEDFLGQCCNAEFNLKGLRKSSNKDVRLELGRISVKFHERSLIDVIQEENS